MNLVNLKRNQKIFLVIFVDIFSAFLSWFVFGPPGSIYISGNFSTPIYSIVFENFTSFIFPILASVIFLFFSGFYSQLIRFFDSSFKYWSPLLGALIFGISWSLIHIMKYEYLVPGFFYIIFLQGLVISFVFFSLLRTSRDIAKNILFPYSASLESQKVIIYGAGATGMELYQALLVDRKHEVIAFFDDSKEFKGRSINKIRVIVDFEELREEVRKEPNLQILLSIPSISMHLRRKIISKLENLRVEVRSIPALHEIVSDRKKMTELQPLSIDDILSRGKVEEFKNHDFTNKSVLITGAGGSIGSEISRQLIRFNVKKIVLFEISEFNLFMINKELNDLVKEINSDLEIISILGDIKDKKRLSDILKRFEIDVVYHAAAYKHVPIVESNENIIFSIRNNVIGTFNVMHSCIENNIESAVLISSDKAVRPKGIMGATKRMAEQITQSLFSEYNTTRLSMVRFGNVIDSSGSVIPLFRKQIADGGPVTVTHNEVTRYFMTIPEASNLVIQSERFAKGGEVFLLDMGEQVKILDLAKKLIHLSGNSIANDSNSNGIQIEEIGLREGEKLFEELLISGDEESTNHSKIFKSVEEFTIWEKLDNELMKLNDAIERYDINSAISILEYNVEGFHYEDQK